MSEGLLIGAESLVPAHDVLLLDLDGVVYLGDEGVPGAADALSRSRELGAAVHFVTNNASRRADAVADRLRGLGVAAEPDEVTTSSQGAAALLADRCGRGAVVLVVGATALHEELTEAGLTPTRSADDKPVAVVQGYGREVGWEQLAEASIALRRGALWVATNLDSSLPSPRGPLPGNGAMVAALRTATGRTPDLVVGKPEPALFRQAAALREAKTPLVVGDRLDTDIEGGVRAEMPSLLVLTGVTGPAELLAAPAQMRPTYLAEDLGGLLTEHPAVAVDRDGRTGRCRDWTARITDDAIALSGSGDRVDALRAACGLGWAAGVERFAPDARRAVGLEPDGS